MKVEFIKDYATKKKGETMEVDGMLASSLINIHKVAVKFKEVKPKKAPVKKAK